MGAEMGRPGDPVGIFARLGAAPFEHDFFHVLRRIECAFPERPRLGTAARPADEPIRLGQDPSLAFAPASLAALRPARNGGAPRLAVNFFGLLGPNGPLPLHLTEFTRDRELHGGDTTFARFLDVFHHRFLAMFYRAWAQARPTVSLDRPRDDRFAAYVGSLPGIGVRELQDRDAVADHAKLFHAGLLARQVRNCDGLVAMLAGYFRIPVRIEEFVGHWMALAEDERTRLGVADGAALVGRGAVLGRRVWDRQHKFRVLLGPLSLARYEGFLPGGAALAKLVAWVRNYFGFELKWDVRLLLKRDEVPAVRLGRYGRLGWTTWLGAYPKPGDAGDLTLDAERLAGRAAA
jgi:type VI secretion system protein ImpH